MKARRPQSGHTLAELMVVLAIVAVITALCSSGLADVVSDTRVQTTVRKLHQGLAMARTAAINRSRLVTVCPLNTANRCSHDWSKPISIFLDPHNARALTDQRRLLNVIPHPGSVSLQVRPARKRYFQFAATGLSHGALGSVLLCGEKGGVDGAAYMAVNMDGRVRELWDLDGDGRISTRYGSHFDCHNRR